MAKTEKAAEADKQTEIEQARQEVQKSKTEADRLAQAAAQPGTAPEQVATDGRKLALLSRKISGPWGAAAAEEALSGPDAAVLAYVKTGRAKAVERDDREQATHLYETSENPAVRAAAFTALTADGTAATEFVSTGQYQAAAPDNRLQIARITDQAGPAVKAAGLAALKTNTPEALQAFLDKGLTDAQSADDRLATARLIDSAGDERKAAARIALEGAAVKLRAFVAEGQYTAQRKDQLAAVHIADVTGLIAQASAASARAQQTAAEAQRAAAVARGAAAEANGYANTAQQAANTAADYVTTAQSAADRAQSDAAKAAQSAKTAKAAEGLARRSAAEAMYSAKQAGQSASRAQWSADDAYSSAAAARASAVAAGKDAIAAQAAADDAFNVHQAKYEAEEKAAREAVEKARKEAEQAQKEQDEATAKAKQDAIAGIEEEIKKQKEKNDDVNSLYHIISEGIHFTLDVIGGVGGVFAPGLADIADLINCAYYGIEGKVEKATQSCIGAIPIVGDAAAIAKFVQWTKKFGSWGKKAAEFIEKVVARTPKSCPVRAPLPNSFPAGTKVLMADGSTLPIEQVRVGDYVTAADPDFGETSSRRVDATIYTPDDRDFTDLTIQSPDGTTATITSTDQHPFWAENQHAWRNAADLTTGDTVRTATGQTAQITTSKHWKTLQPAYNLTVDTVHTYFVMAGSSSILVHNAAEFDCWKVSRLQEHESGKIGHTISKHVGKSDKELIDRTDVDVASTFEDWAGAEFSTLQNIRQNSEKVQEFLDGQKFKVELISMGAPWGSRAYQHSTGKFVTPNRVITWLRKDLTMPEGFRIETSYPAL
ncbi:polymorphic toxin-type HINT domain-containing protein [Kitasatospora sp. NPDC059817]|uniref:polymorphic toxin-type HINT domain-containing protein n=1 Tax=Kitasatospora sp. NPDC059817 TaxID=3346961 RepID=UPI003655F4F1